MSNKAEDLEVTPSYGAQSPSYQTGSQNSVTPPENGDIIQLHLSLAWSNRDFPEFPGQLKDVLQSSLQMWLSKNTKSDCKVEQVDKNKTAVVKMAPHPDPYVLQKVIKVPLTKDGKTITITDIRKITHKVSAQALRQPLLNTPSSESRMNSGTSSLQLHLNLAWSDSDFADFPSSRVKNNFEISFQSWLCKNTESVCEDVQVFEDKTAVVTITPFPDLNVLQKVIGVPLTRDGKSIMIVAGRVIPPGTPAQARGEPLLNTPPLSGSQVDPVQARPNYCLPVSHFWYLSHVYREEISRIETESGIEIKAEVNVEIEEPERKNMACSKFEELCRCEFSGFSIPLNKINPDGWAKAMNIIQKNENKFLLTLSSEELTIFGPERGHEDFRKAFSFKKEDREESALKSQDTPLKTHIVDEGLTVEERYWKLLTKEERQELSEMKATFGLNHQAKHQDKVSIKACHKQSEDLSAAYIRNSLQRGQKTTKNPTLWKEKIYSASGYSSFSEAATSGYGRNRASGQRDFNARAPLGGVERAAYKEEDTCPICMDAFTNKKQLKCKHEFCENCLEQSKKSLGPICPLCTDVFGRVEGNQPPGTMTYRTEEYRLPGFRCPTIVIDYEMPSGIQTEKHPNPGYPYSGVYRTAYLPDNDDGREVLKLLKRAFDQKLIFTVRTSRTTGRENQVTWNNIDHKTSKTGGPQCFGYPDPDYLNRVREELKAQGIQ